MADESRYRVIRRIGQGGMAEVLEAETLGEAGFRRRVALKRMLAGHEADASFARMFLDEARIASQLHHANIVAVLDYGTAGGLPFQVLELIDGADAARLGRLGREAGAPMPLPQALYITMQVAHALEYAHAARGADGQPLGIVHRDVSPGNVLVSWGGDVKLTDFGIAFARDRTERTSAGTAKGTLLYMAPEQAVKGHVDGRADVFSLGCVLHTLVTGASPLAGDGKMMDLLAGGELPLAPGLPDDLAEIVGSAVRCARAERWESAGAMAAALGRALARRVDEDPRAMLVEWLRRVRPAGAAPAAARGRLDALLAVDFVLAAADGEVRRFEARPSAEIRAVEVEESDGSGGARSEDAVTAGSASTSAMVRALRRGRRRGWMWLAAAGIAVAAAVAGGVALLRGGEGAAAPGPAAGEPGAAVAMAMDAAPAAPVAVADVDAAPVAVVKAPPVEPARGRPGHAARPPVEPPPPVERPPRDQYVPPAVTTGFVHVGGQGALRAEIFVDGKSRGFAPKKLELPVGEHTLELARADGSRVGPAKITVTARHTPSSPLRWTVP